MSVYRTAYACTEGGSNCIFYADSGTPQLFCRLKTTYCFRYFNTRKCTHRPVGYRMMHPARKRRKIHSIFNCTSLSIRFSTILILSFCGPLNVAPNNPPPPLSLRLRGNTFAPFHTSTVDEQINHENRKRNRCPTTTGNNTNICGKRVIRRAQQHCKITRNSRGVYARNAKTDSLNRVNRTKR